MDWVHCNNCYIQPGDVENKKFVVTNCGHIYCEGCHQSNKSGECYICQVQYSAIPLSSNMNSEVEIYFHDPLINLKKQIKVLDFQQSHRLRLVTHHLEKIRNYKAIKKENFDLNEELKLCKKQNEILREEIKILKRDFHEFKQRCEISRENFLSSKNTPTHSFRQFMTKVNPEFSSNTKKSRPNEEKGLKRPYTSNFFLMEESKPKNDIFTTPELRKLSTSYRSYKTSTPDLNTPPTPETFFKACSQNSALQRKVKLPSNSSPITRIGLHGLSLTRSTSTPRKDIINKFSKYYK